MSTATTETKIAEAPFDATRVARLLSSPNGVRVALVNLVTGGEFFSVPLAARTRESVAAALGVVNQLRARLAAAAAPPPMPSPELAALLSRVRAVREAVVEELPDETFDGEPMASAVLAAAPTEADLAHLLANGRADEARRRVARLEAMLSAARSGVAPGSLDPDAFRAPEGSFAQFVAMRPVPFAQRFGAGAPEPIDASTQFARAQSYAMSRYRRTVASLKTIPPLKAAAFRRRIDSPNWETEFHKAKTIPALNALLKRLDVIDAEIAPIAASYVRTPLTSFKAIVTWYQNELPNYYTVTPADLRDRVTISRGARHPIVLTPAAMGALPIGRLLANRWWEAAPYESAVQSALDAAIADARKAGMRRDQPIPVLVRFHGIAEPFPLVARVVGEEIVLDAPSRFGAGAAEELRPRPSPPRSIAARSMSTRDRIAELLSRVEFNDANGWGNSAALWDRFAADLAPMAAPLTGSEKQVAWATSLRDKALPRIAQVLLTGRGLDAIDARSGRKPSPRALQREAERLTLYARLLDSGNAEAWIDTRNRLSSALGAVPEALRNLMGDAVF